MNARRNAGTSLRQFAASHVMSVLALFIVVMLPLHGIVNAAAAIQSPAHYHGHAQRDLSPAADHHLNEEPNATTGLDDDHASASQPDHDHDHAHAGKPVSSVGHHAHALDAADVVYLDGDSEQTERGTIGKQLTVNGDALLTGWSMIVMPRLGAQILPEPGCEFDSHAAALHLRPPSTDGVSTA